MPADGHLFGRVRGPICIDLFAGGGGASEGIRRALGHGPVVAINHCKHAIEMHRTNHPETEHYCESVFDVPPLNATRGRAVDLLWASPDCRHFSRAKGGKPVDRKIRGLAWVIVDWARQIKPRVIMMENVPEFVTWGPVGADDTPIKDRAGETFAEFVEQLRAEGYAVEWRTLIACDYGAPTSRKRFYLVARCDGQPIRWPEPTHGPGRAKPWHTAAECVDWTIPMLSIFATPTEAREWAKATGADGVPVRPLAEATQRRIAEGVRRFVLNNPRPFLVNLSHGGRVENIDEPANTLTSTPKGGDRCVVAPVIVKAHSNGSDTPRSGVRDLDTPGPTLTATEQFALAAATLIDTGNGEREGQAPRARDADRPFKTVTSKGSQGGVVAAFLSRHFTGVVGKDIETPMPTVTAVDHHSLGAVFLDEFHGSAKAGQPITEPAATVTGQGNHAALISAFLCAFYGSERDGQPLTEPVRTVTTTDRFGLVTLTIDGTECAIVDIAMRMLQPRELAAAQGWPTMKLHGTKGDQVARIGNMVCPDVVEALTQANLGASHA